MSTDFSYDVFLSHSSKDKPVVRKLAERLKAFVCVDRRKTHAAGRRHLER